MSLFKNFFEKKKKAKDIEQQENEAVKDIVKLIGCEYEHIDTSLTSGEITEIYIEEYNKGKKSGYTPVILVVSDTLLESIEINLEDNGGIDIYRNELLKKDISNGKIFLKERFESAMPEEDEEDDDEFDIYGDFNESIKPDRVFISLDDEFRDKNTELIIVKIPTANPWEVFVWIPFGGWNECPDEEEQMSVCKYWYDLYGAVPAVITSDILQMYVQMPVRDKEAALKLAEEQFGFCEDIVYQGMGNIKSLASTLINSSIWYFWWD